MAHVFISYVRENSKIVDRLVSTLEVFGIDVWVDKKNLRPGYRWEDTIREAIEKGGFFICCFSEEYIKKDSTYMNEELVIAIEELRKRHTSSSWFIPVIISKCQLPNIKIGAGDTLRSLQNVPLYKDYDAGVSSILSVLDPTSQKVLDLTNSLKSPLARVKIRAIDDLGEIGTNSEYAIPQLLKCLEDENYTVRGVAANTLGRIGIFREDIIVALLRIKNDGSHYGSEHAISSICSFGIDAVPILIKNLESQEDHVLLALRNIGEDAVAAVPHLLKLLETSNSWLLIPALNAIGDKRALPELIKIYKKHVASAAIPGQLPS